MKFSELDLKPELLSTVKRAGFEEATPIQGQTIPLALAGKDVIGQAQTGTGKTAAFGLPILQGIEKGNDSIQALVIEPTRELAIQTQEELYRLGRDEKAKVQVVYGGADIRRQIRALKQGPTILVGTPGRLLDHLKRGTVHLDNIKTVVLDEADEMLDMGFVQDIESILKYAANDHQTLLFSATMPKPIMRISEKFMNNPEIIKIKGQELTADLIDQYFVRTKENEKFEILCRLIDVQNPDLAVIFCRTKRRVDEVSRGLQARGYDAAGIHGDLSQNKRMSVLKRFRSEKLDILVATDVAARGLDISGVSHVYNYDIPQDPDSYVHRIGRTGRAGKNGNSITFVTPNEIGYMKTIEKLTRKSMLPLVPPTDAEALKSQLASAIKDVADSMKGDLSKYTEDASKLLDDYSAVDLVSVLLKNLAKDSEAVKVTITPERPLRGGRGGNRGRNFKRGGDRNEKYRRHSNTRRGNGDRNHGHGDRDHGHGGGYGDRDHGHGGSRGGYGNRDHGHGGSRGGYGDRNRDHGNGGGSRNRNFVIKNKD